MVKIKTEAWIYLIVLSLIWGSSFILMKRGLEAYPSAQMASLRIIIAGLVMLPVAVANYKKINRKQFFYVALFGFTNAAVPAFLFAESETVVSSSTAGILNSLSPIFTFIAGALLFRQVFNWFGFAGVIIGFGGACLLVFKGHPNADLIGGHASWVYPGMILIATCCYGIASNIIKTYLQEVPGYIVSSFSYLTFAIPLAIWLLFFSDFTVRVTHHPQGLHSLLFIAILAIMGSGLAIVLLVRLIQISSALFGSFVTYLMPIVSIFWGVLSHESINFVTIISLFIIFAGIIVAQLHNNRKAENKK